MSSGTEFGTEFWNGVLERKSFKLFPEHIPHLLDKIEIRRVSEPLRALDIFTFEEIVLQDYSVTRRVIIP